jgi:hypothetical protein
VLSLLPPLNSFRKASYLLACFSFPFVLPLPLPSRDGGRPSSASFGSSIPDSPLPSGRPLGPLRASSARPSSLFTSTLFACHGARCGPPGFSRERPVGGATRESILRLPKFVKHFLVIFLKNFFRTPELVKHCCCCKFSHGQPCARPAFTFLPVKAREIPSD